MAFVSKLNDVCARLKVVIATHSDVAAAQVHKTRRFFLDPASWPATHWQSGTKLISGWEIDRERSPEEEFEGSVSNFHRRRHDLVIVAYRQIWPQDKQTGTADDGRLTWRTTVEEVCDLIRRDMFVSVPLTIAGIEPLLPPIVDVDEPRDLFGEMCHYVEIRLSVVERIVWP